MGHIPYLRLSTLYFVYFATVGIISPYWSVYLDSLGFDGRDIGLIIALPMLTRLAAPNVWGWLADRTGQHLRVIQLGALLAFLTFSGLFFTTSFVGVVFFTCVFTFFWNAILPQFEVITLDHLHKDARFYSRIRLWGSVGFIFAVVGLGGGLEIYPESLMLWIVSGLLFAIFLCAVSLPKTDHLEAINRKDEAFLASLKRSSVRSFLASALFLHLSHGAFYGFYSLYLMALGYSSWLVGCLWAVGVIAEIVLFVKVPSIFNRFSLRHCFIVCCAAAVVRWLLVTWLSDSVIITVAAQMLHAFTFGLAHSVSIEYVRKSFSISVRGKAQAFYSAVCFGGGGAVGAYLSGILWSVDGRWCFLAAAVFALIGLLVALYGMRDPVDRIEIKAL